MKLTNMVMELKTAHDSSFSCSSLPQHEEKAAATAALSNVLNAEWTFWFDNPRLSPSGDWKDSLKKIGSFSTVSLFWSIFNNLKPTDALSSNSNYSVFRTGVEPSWEDPANCDGGKFVLELSRNDAKTGKLDECWLYTILAIIGETMDETGDQVNGAVVSLRKNGWRIALWIKTIDRDACTMIGERWKKVLHLDEKVTIRYQTHRDAAASGRSFRNEVQFKV
jgi:translation initiation factor 4E